MEGRMNPELLAALQPVAERLRAILADKPELSGWLRDLGRAILAVTEPRLAAAPVQPPVAAPPTRPSAALVPLPAPLPPSSVPVAPNTVTVAVAAPPVEAPRPSPTAVCTPEPAGEPAHFGGWYRSVYDDELAMIEQRCRIKAEGARWAAKRRRLLKEAADYATEIEPHDQELIGRAKELPDCFLWMCHRDGPSPEDLSLFEDLAGCFETMASAIGILEGLLNNPQDPEAFEHAIDLAAEAQSSVRAAILEMDGPTDGDQQKVFSWLRSAAAERQILIRRYMRRDDPADPRAWPALQERLQQLEERLQRYKNRDRTHKKLFNTIRYHLKRIAENSHPQDAAHDWKKIIESGDELVTEGLPPSNVELRDLLLPILDDIPEEVELPKNFELVLREIDRFLSSRPTKPDPAITAASSQDVRRARDLLKGRAVVMIGGDRRPFSSDALIESFGLKELIWIETREHQTHTVFEPHVARTDVALVLLAIRWSSHSFGEVKEYCDKYGKPLVHLPAGYNPNQVAFHILKQVEERLRETA
jgi:hypothetical protein